MNDGDGAEQQDGGPACIGGGVTLLLLPTFFVVDFCYHFSPCSRHPRSGDPIGSPGDQPEPIVLVRGV